jgi:hypothetical protein
MRGGGEEGRGGIQEDKSEAPNFDLAGRLEETSETEVLDFDVSSILFESVDHELSFGGFEEPEGRLGEFLVGELDDECIGEDGDRTGDDAFHDEACQNISIIV